MGAVYLAEHPGIGRKAAVKVLHPQLSRNSDIATRFFNEARAANAIHHPGIVEVFEFGTLPTGVSYIVMELLEGESLAARMRPGEHLSRGRCTGLGEDTDGGRRGDARPHLARAVPGNEGGRSHAFGAPPRADREIEPTACRAHAAAQPTAKPAKR